MVDGVVFLWHDEALQCASSYLAWTCQKLRVATRESGKMGVAIDSSEKTGQQGTDDTVPTKNPIFSSIVLPILQSDLMRNLKQNCSSKRDLQYCLKDHHPKLIGFQDFQF